MIEALRNRLMQPEACAEFSTAFEVECARAEKEMSGRDAGRQRELEKVRHKLDELVEAIASGLRSTTLRSKLAELEARQAELEQETELPARPSIALPADLSAAYRLEVDQLSASKSNDGPDGTETRELIRSLIERVVITSTPDGKATEVELVGGITAMINLAMNAKGPRKHKLSGPMSDSFASSVQVVAGTRNQRWLRVPSSINYLGNRVSSTQFRSLSESRIPRLAA